MRRQDKRKNIEQANLMLENSYLKSKGFINEFWPFTKSKKQTKQEPEEEVYKSTTPPREILIDLEKVPGFFDLKSDSRPNKTEVWLEGGGTPIYLGFKDIVFSMDGKVTEVAIKYKIQYFKNTNSIKMTKDYFYSVYGDRNQYIGDRRLEYPKGGEEEVAMYQKFDKTFFEKGDSVPGLYNDGSTRFSINIDILDVNY